MFPLLNHLELAKLAEKLNQECSGAFLERLIIPERPQFLDGFLKNEWVLRLEKRRQEYALFLQLRPQACGVALLQGRGPKHAAQSTRSPFDQALSKYLKGLKLIRIRAVELERMIVFEFSGYYFILVLIPALPEALLVDSSSLEILARSRTIRDPQKQASQWTWPAPRQVPQNLKLREDLFETSERLYQKMEHAIELEAFRIRLDRVTKALSEKKKYLSNQVAQSQSALSTAEAEPDWSSYGEALKSRLHDLPPLLGGSFQIGELNVPCELAPAEQVEHFFQLARRKKRRREAALSRLQEASDRLKRLEISVQLEANNWKALSRLEGILGLQGWSPTGETSGENVSLKAPVPAHWRGKVFRSKEGYPILVGKSREENLELTFKVAKGNDLWMHVRGRPGAHVMIPVPSGKTVSLETLLDAAALCIYWSGGKSWGKTEVDYTFKKYVKRIKDSSEASYTHNKTLIALPDESRLERLLSNPL